VSRVQPERLIVHCSVWNAGGRLVGLRLVRVTGARTAETLDTVLRLALVERRLGRSLIVEAPADLVVLLALCGLADRSGEVKP
jgi:hypothetical protein